MQPRNAVIANLKVASSRAATSHLRIAANFLQKIHCLPERLGGAAAFCTRARGARMSTNPTVRTEIWSAQPRSTLAKAITLAGAGLSIMALSILTPPQRAEAQEKR